MNQIIIADNYGNRFYELFEHNGQVSGFDYTLGRIIRSEDVGIEELEAPLNELREFPLKALEQLRFQHRLPESELEG